MMLLPKLDTERQQMLPFVYKVGAGYFPSEESFALIVETDMPEYVISDFFSSETIDTEIDRLTKHAGWGLIFFILHKSGVIRVTRDDAEWFLNHRAHY